MISQSFVSWKILHTEISFNITVTITVIVYLRAVMCSGFPFVVVKELKH